MGLRRRYVLQGLGLAGVGILTASCSSTGQREGGERAAGEENREAEGREPEVTATEDLMREHGVLRRALLVYTESANHLDENTSLNVLEALQKTAHLFRTFGEEYHEKKLEETYIFPAVKSAGGPAADYPDILIAQHQRGREITDYILAVTQKARLGSPDVASLKAAMQNLVLMYRNHAAREDTIVFPAWKETLSPDRLDEMGERFEEIEQAQFGADGYEEAVRTMGQIEASLGYADLSQFTAPPPAKA
jgi:hemerythrin-like domain-containing protein